MTWAQPPAADQIRAVYLASHILTDHFGSTEWVNRVDLSKLNMSSLHSCVLAQVYGNYHHDNARAVRSTMSARHHDTAASHVFAAFDTVWAQRITEIRNKMEPVSAPEPATVSTSPFNSAELEMLMELVTERISDLQPAGATTKPVRTALANERARYLELQTAISRLAS